MSKKEQKIINEEEKSPISKSSIEECTIELDEKYKTFITTRIENYKSLSPDVAIVAEFKKLLNELEKEYKGSLTALLSGMDPSALKVLKNEGLIPEIKQQVVPKKNGTDSKEEKVEEKKEEAFFRLPKFKTDSIKNNQIKLILNFFENLLKNELAMKAVLSKLDKIVETHKNQSVPESLIIPLKQKYIQNSERRIERFFRTDLVAMAMLRLLGSLYKQSYLTAEDIFGSKDIIGLLAFAQDVKKQKKFTSEYADVLLDFLLGLGTSSSMLGVDFSLNKLYKNCPHAIEQFGPKVIFPYYRGDSGKIMLFLDRIEDSKNSQPDDPTSPKIFDHCGAEIMLHYSEQVAERFLNLLDNLYLQKNIDSSLETLESVYDLFRQMKISDPTYQHMGAAAAAHQTPKIIKKIITLYKKLCNKLIEKDSTVLSSKVLKDNMAEYIIPKVYLSGYPHSNGKDSMFSILAERGQGEVLLDLINEDDDNIFEANLISYPQFGPSSMQVRQASGRNKECDDVIVDIPRPLGIQAQMQSSSGKVETIGDRRKSGRWSDTLKKTSVYKWFEMHSRSVNLKKAKQVVCDRIIEMKDEKTKATLLDKIVDERKEGSNVFYTSKQKSPLGKFFALETGFFSVALFNAKRWWTNFGKLVEEKKRCDNLMQPIGGKQRGDGDEKTSFDNNPMYQNLKWWQS